MLINFVMIYHKKTVRRKKKLVRMQINIYDSFILLHGCKHCYIKYLLPRINH